MYAFLIFFPCPEALAYDSKILLANGKDTGLSLYDPELNSNVFKLLYEFEKV